MVTRSRIYLRFVSSCFLTLRGKKHISLQICFAQEEEEEAAAGSESDTDEHLVAAGETATHVPSVSVPAGPPQTRNKALAPTGGADWYLHLQYGCGISHLPSVPNGQRVVGNLQVELLKVDLDHLRSKKTHDRLHKCAHEMLQSDT